MAFHAAPGRAVASSKPEMMPGGPTQYRIALLGRYILSGGREYPCQTRELSVDRAAVYAPVRGEAGEGVTLHVTGLGPLPGRIADAFPGGFGIDLALPEHRREELDRRMRLVVDRAGSAMSDARLLSDEGPQQAQLRLATGAEIAAEVMSLSLSGASVKVGAALPIGMRLMIGKTPGRVIRNREDCAMIEFLAPVRKIWPTGKIDF